MDLPVHDEILWLACVRASRRLRAAGALNPWTDPRFAFPYLVRGSWMNDMNQASPLVDKANVKNIGPRQATLFHGLWRLSLADLFDGLTRMPESQDLQGERDRGAQVDDVVALGRLAKDLLLLQRGLVQPCERRERLRQRGLVRRLLLRGHRGTLSPAPCCAGRRARWLHARTTEGPHSISVCGRESAPRRHGQPDDQPGRPTRADFLAVLAPGCPGWRRGNADLHAARAC
jgi:hypothetical protein